MTTQSYISGSLQTHIRLWHHKTGAGHFVGKFTRLGLSSLSHRPSTPGQSSRAPTLLQKGIPPSDHGREPLPGLKIARGPPIGGDCGTGFAYGRGVGFAAGRGNGIGGKSVSSNIDQLEASSEARVVHNPEVHDNDGKSQTIYV